MQSYEFIDIHTHKIYGDGTIFIFSRGLSHDAEPPVGTLFSAGIHPWNAQQVDLDAATKYLTEAPVAAVGEIGLDYAAKTDREVQRLVFERQLSIAEQRNLPVIIHCVRAHDDVISQLKLHNLRAAIFHGYIGSPELTAEIVKAGYYLSFNARSFSSPKTVESLCETPMGAIFAETDDRTEHISETYARLAEARGTTVETLLRYTNDNFNRIFR